ncbi:hypothetical protein HYC85_007769 [Camellia sinensis]|uniref:PHD-type domain-containing protein n=1 Tax=Camellia sinensis TaxID=4442 RepID=A0A7J7HPW2_CAMSI|nr:hypothetical protein HYC85_007769 [Camellia sinensis]
MTGVQCHRRRKMMGRGADGGCGTEEKICPISRVPATFPAKENVTLEKQTPIGIDCYTQARKALCERSPFDTEDAQVSTISTLPSGLANFLSRHSDGRKRQKKLHSGVETKAKSSRAGAAEKGRGSKNIWSETEEYFRELTVDDIDKLHELSSFVFSASQKCFSIPVLSNAFRDSEGNGDIANEVNVVNANGVGFDCGVVVDEEAKEEVEQFMKIDSVGANVLVQEEKGCSSSSQMAMSCSGLEWLLGSRSKIYLTSERPSKKRKLLGGDAGLEKLIVASPVDGLSSLCHYCSLGDTGDQLNRLIVCSSCNVSVHQRCYGVQDNVADSWLCSWCNQRNALQSSDRSCLLCPKQGGALKPVSKKGVGSENGGSMEFVHLFCCQWMPEVYIKDTRTMEPVMNIEGIKETRRKLVCFLCKVKCGACVRCSNGTCRTSFHPICAREAKHRMEIWGKFGCDDVELRAFCSKHSEVHNGSSTQQSGNLSIASGSDSYITNHQPVAPTANKPHKFKIGRKNGDKITVHIETTDTNINKLGNSVLHVEGLSDTRLNSKLKSECGNTQEPASTETLDRSTNEEGLSDTRLNSKLKSECGNTQEPASTETLDRSINDDVNTSHTLDFTVILKKLIDRGKVNVKDVASEIGISSDSLASMLADDCLVPDLRCKIVTWLRSHAYIGTLHKNLKIKIKSLLTSKDDMGATEDSNAVMVSESDIPDVLPVKSVPPRRRTKSNIRILKDNKVICSSKETTSDGIVMDEAKRGQLISEDADYSSKESVSDVTEKNLMEPDGVHDTLASNSPKCEGGQAQVAAISQNVTPNSDPENTICSVVKNDIPDLIKAEAVCTYIHPLIRDKMMKMKNVVQGTMKSLLLEASSSSGICCNQRIEHLNSSDMISKFDEAKFEQLVKARNIGVLEMSPENEVEGELIFHQHRLLCNVAARKHLSDDLICKVVKSLPEEIDTIGKRKWDAVLVNQYLSELREAKKQGRKERRHKEAQAVLAAATAAAAASLRISSFRKDTLDESAHPEVVAIHLDCYRSVKDSTGPWKCELCENLLSSRSSGAQTVNSWEKPYFAAECGLCGGSAGAFRKSTDGQWVHAFCAEWVLESTFRRGQVHPVEGMESVVKGSEVCHICHRKQGVCTKCNYGHCHRTFHPSCARSAGFYMNAKTVGGKLQHKAYCEKHSLEQRAKAETQRHGIEELKSLKQTRRDLVLCSQDILVSNRDSIALSALVRSPFFPSDVSSESATTSLKGNTDDCRSGSEAIQRSDDITVDSTVSGERLISETFEKELVMTSDQASVKNQRLPKGFVYVPIGCLSKEKETIPDAYSGKPLERDGNAAEATVKRLTYTPMVLKSRRMEIAPITRGAPE